MLYHQAVGMSLFGNDSDLISLVERCRRRDGRAWSILVERYSRLVYSIPRRYSLPKTTPPTFIKAHSKRCANPLTESLNRQRCLVGLP